MILGGYTPNKKVLSGLYADSVLQWGFLFPIAESTTLILKPYCFNKRHVFYRKLFELRDPVPTPPKGNPSIGFAGSKNINSQLLDIINVSELFLYIAPINSPNRCICKVYIIPIFIWENWSLS